MHGKIAKRLIGTAAAAVMAVSTLTAALPSQAAYKQEEYLTWSQLDERWSATPMDSTTIRSSGCLITALSIMIMDSGSLDDAARGDGDGLDPAVGAHGTENLIRHWLTPFDLHSLRN
jgi:hypothetical protein